MTRFRFIHCSDLHIDSPFKGLRSAQPDLADRLRASTFQAFQNVVELAIREKVDAVVIAGDIYDSADKSLQAQLKFRQGLITLSNAGIASFIAHGNHDPMDSRFAKLQLPDLATVFSENEVDHHILDRPGKPPVHFYGISYPTRDVTENLALKFEKKPAAGFSIGVLHTNVGSNPDHGEYAPCSLADLVSRKMDYWALGHIHQFQVLSESHPAIVYSGNTQARHKNEAGRKGCCLVTLHAQSPPEIQFMAIDALRFVQDSLDLSPAQSLDQVMESIHTKCLSLSSQAEERDVLIHLTLTGRTPVHDDLRQTSAVEQLGASIQSGLAGRKPSLWVNLVLSTQGTYDENTLKQGNDFIADFLALYENLEPEQAGDALRQALSPLHDTWTGSKYLETLSPENLKELLLKARHLTLDHLVDSD